MFKVKVHVFCKECGRYMGTEDGEDNFPEDKTLMSICQNCMAKLYLKDSSPFGN